MEEKKVKISFWRIFWPTLTAIVLTSFIGWMVTILFFGGLIAAFSTADVAGVKENTILHLTLKGEISEKGKANINPTDFTVDNSIGLRDLLYGFEKAKKDDNIKGIYGIGKKKAEKLLQGKSKYGKFRVLCKEYKKESSEWKQRIKTNASLLIFK